MTYQFPLLARAQTGDISVIASSSNHSQAVAYFLILGNCWEERSETYKPAFSLPYLLSSFTCIALFLVPKSTTSPVYHLKHIFQMADNTYNLVQSRYGDMAEQSKVTQQQAQDEDIARAFGYSAEDLSSLPEKTNLGLSCGNPVGFANVNEVRPPFQPRPGPPFLQQQGETVVDLGSGSGIDVLLAARKVGSSGKAIGVDMTKVCMPSASISS